MQQQQMSSSGGYNPNPMLGKSATGNSNALQQMINSQLDVSTSAVDEIVNQKLDVIASELEELQIQHTRKRNEELKVLDQQRVNQIAKIRAEEEKKLEGLKTSIAKEIMNQLKSGKPSS